MDQAIRTLMDPAFALPRDQGDFEFGDLLAGSLAHHQAAVSRMAGEVGARLRGREPAMETLRTSLRSAFARHRTERDAARQVLAAGVDAIWPELMAVSRANSALLREQAAYRVRESADQDLVARGDLYHVPFELAQRVSACRYSAAGVPCLYLGASVQLCWLEARGDEVGERPFYAARFELDLDRLTILDLSCSPLQLVGPFRTAQLLADAGCPIDPLAFSDMPPADDFPGYVAAFIAIWPLLLATSVRGGDGGDRPQYAIPQLLMELVQRSRQMDGIRYFSTRHSRIRSSQDLPINYAFPAKDLHVRGHCPYLAERIHCTEPLPLSVFVDAPELALPRSLAESEIRNVRRGWVSLVEGGPYGPSAFGRVEYALDQLPVAPVGTPGLRERQRLDAVPA